MNSVQSGYEECLTVTVLRNEIYSKIKFWWLFGSGFFLNLSREHTGAFNMDPTSRIVQQCI